MWLVCFLLEVMFRLTRSIASGHVDDTRMLRWTSMCPKNSMRLHARIFMWQTKVIGCLMRFRPRPNKRLKGKWDREQIQRAERVRGEAVPCA